MRDKFATFALFFPEPMDGVDRVNLEASRVRRVQLFLGVAADPRQAEQLRYLAGGGVRVTLRIEEPEPGQEAGSYYDPSARAGLWARVQAVAAIVPVEAVVVGNEPEHSYALEWTSQDWGNLPSGGRAGAHNGAVAAMTPLLRTLGVRVVSPGWTHRRITPRDPAQPGRMTWRELTLPSYNGCDANGAHVYAHNWLSEEDHNRYLWWLGEEVARCHRAVWVNETAANTGDQQARMRAVISMYELASGTSLGGRIESFCPFVSNGTGNSYPPGYIMRQAECYTLLGGWMGG